MTKRFFVPLFVGILALGCGGGGGSTKATIQSISHTINLTSSPKLEDGSHYARFTIIGLSNGTAAIKASSTQLDPILVIEKVKPDSTSETVASDDDSGGGTSASAVFDVEAGATYTGIVTSAGTDAAGSVTVEYPTGKVAVSAD